LDRASCLIYTLTLDELGAVFVVLEILGLKDHEKMLHDK
jgi:hypothetical protein